MYLLCLQFLRGSLLISDSWGAGIEGMRRRLDHPDEWQNKWPAWWGLLKESQWKVIFEQESNQSYWTPIFIGNQADITKGFRQLRVRFHCSDKAPARRKVKDERFVSDIWVLGELALLSWAQSKSKLPWHKGKLFNKEQPENRGDNNEKGPWYKQSTDQQPKPGTTSRITPWQHHQLSLQYMDFLTKKPSCSNHLPAVLDLSADLGTQLSTHESLRSLSRTCPSALGLTGFLTHQSFPLTAIYTVKCIVCLFSHPNLMALHDNRYIWFYES